MFGDPVSPCSSWNIVRSGSDLFFMFIENKRLERLKDPRMFVYLVHVSNERDGGYFLGMITNPIIKKEKSYNPRYVFHCAYLTQANPYRPI